MAIEAFAPAKINLTLHVTGQRTDGYHLLDSLVVFADVGDRLVMSVAPNMALEVTGPFARGIPSDARNLVWKAAEAADQTLAVTLHKNLPHGGGIGGGSSDAAAVLRTFGAHGAAISLGADVPVCLSNTPQRMRGIGEDVCPVPDIPALDLVLVTPHVHVSTPDVFKRLRNKQNPPMDRMPKHDRAAFLGWLKSQRNDLQAPAAAGNPAILVALKALQDAELARMSGSGSTCFGIYPSADAATRAAQFISAKNPRWWVQPVRTIGS